MAYSAGAAVIEDLDGDNVGRGGIAVVGASRRSCGVGTVAIAIGVLNVAVSVLDRHSVRGHSAYRVTTEGCAPLGASAERLVSGIDTSI